MYQQTQEHGTGNQGQRVIYPLYLQCRRKFLFFATANIKDFQTKDTFVACLVDNDSCQHARKLNATTATTYTKLHFSSIFSRNHPAVIAWFTSELCIQ